MVPSGGPSLCSRFLNKLGVQSDANHHKSFGLRLTYINELLQNLFFKFDDIIVFFNGWLLFSLVLKGTE